MTQGDVNEMLEHIRKARALARSAEEMAFDAVFDTIVRLVARIGELEKSGD